jgi:hypothetical protein
MGLFGGDIIPSWNRKQKKTFFLKKNYIKEQLRSFWWRGWF